MMRWSPSVELKPIALPLLWPRLEIKSGQGQTARGKDLPAERMRMQRVAMEYAGLTDPSRGMLYIGPFTFLDHWPALWRNEQ